MQGERFEYEFEPGGEDEARALLYQWEILDGEGRLVGQRYVGKSSGGSGRPKRHYRRNVERLLSGRPYRRGKPDEFRAIHRAMAEAVRQGWRVKLTLLRNVEEGKDINEAERRAQDEYGCR